MKFEIVPSQIEDSHDNLHEALMDWDATGADTLLIDNAPQTLVGSRKLIGQPLGINSHTFEAVIKKTAKLTVISHSHEPDPEPDPHPDDLEKQKEHLAMLALATEQEATHKVIQSGSFTNPAIWNNGLPTPGAKIYVPKDLNLTIDANIETRLKWMRVDGTLIFAMNVNTSLLIDTIIGNATSRLIINNPNSAFISRIIFTDDGPIDFIKDPFALSRGFIWHGSAIINGHVKNPYTEYLPTNIGDTQIIVSDATEWQVGDYLILASNIVVYQNYGYHVKNQDDTVRITEIIGNIIKLDHALLFNHKAVEVEIPHLVKQNPIVANLTRNIIFESESITIARRGHVMFMHNPNISVNYAAFISLGRTDKTKQVTDPDGLGNGLSNPRGRYSLHCHRTGTQSVTIDLIGCVINDSIGWGLVSHDSNVNVTKCVGYKGFGSLFVTELGNECGLFKNNIAIRCDGINTISGNGRSNNDVGFHGDGFWIEGQHTPLIGNIAIACKNSGFTFHTIIGLPITFKNNISLSQVTSLILWDVGGNGNETPPSDNLIEENFLQGGIHQGYISKTTYKGNTIIALDSNLSNWGFGHTGVNTGIEFIDNRVVGFQQGVLMPTNGYNLLRGGYYNNLKANLYLQNTQQGWKREIKIENPTFGSKAEWDIDMTVSFFSYSLMPAYPRGPYMSTAVLWPYEKLFEKPNTAIGHPTSKVYYNNDPLFFEEQGADFEFGKHLTRLPDNIRFEPDGITLATTASLANRGKIVGGDPLPVGRQYHLPKIRGVLVGE